MDEDKIRKLFREAITHEEELDAERLMPVEKVEKRDAISDLLKGYLTKKQIEDFDYKNGLNPDELRDKK